MHFPERSSKVAHPGGRVTSFDIDSTAVVAPFLLREAKRRSVARRAGAAGAIACALLLSACDGPASFLPGAGPSTREMAAAAAQPVEPSAGSAAIQVIDIDGAVARRTAASQRSARFSQSLPQALTRDHVFGPGDVLEVAVWEAPPAMLYTVSASMSDGKTISNGARMVVVPEKALGADGVVSIPFAGSVDVLGKTPAAVEIEVAQRLKGKANQPQVFVRVVRNVSATVTVVGEVASSVIVPLTARGERLLDALAAAGGSRQPVDRMTIQVTRGGAVQSMPLGQVIRMPTENVALQAGDVVTLFAQPLSVMVLGATGKNDELSFESQGISLAQAIARAGGLQDSRADARGVFVFRFEEVAALAAVPPGLNAQGRVPVVYRVDLRDPASFFAAQTFAIRDKDVLYVSNAPATELQKFLNIAVSMAYPLINVANATK